MCWKRVASKLGLQETQVEQLRAMRRESMFRLDSLYVVRGMLSQQMQTLGASWRKIVEDCSKVGHPTVLRRRRRDAALYSMGSMVYKAALYTMGSM
eukprot:4351825-Pyramimonas_sp.AAC.1